MSKQIKQFQANNVSTNQMAQPIQLSNQPNEPTH